MPKDISLDDIKEIALRAYRGGEVRSAYVDKSDDNSLISEEKTELPPESVDNPEENAPESEETVEAVEDATTVTDSPDCDTQSSESEETKARDWPDLELDIARALWEGELHWEFIPSEVEQWARKMVKRRDGEMMRWLLVLQQVPDILSRSREFIFKVIRSPHDPEIYLTPEAIDAYVASFVEQETVEEVPWSEEATADIAETLTLERDAQRLAKFLEPEAVDLPEGPDADDEWVPGVPEGEPETTVESETADAPDIAEPETVDAEATESEIYYSPETDMPTFLRDLTPVNGAEEDGRLFATVDALNERLAGIPAGGSLVLWGLDNGLNHSADGYSSTQIRIALRRGKPAATYWYKDAPRRQEDSRALFIGSAVHAALLEPERFATEYACAPSVNLRTSEGKETLASFECDCATRNLIPIKREDFDTVCMMRDSVLAFPVVRLLLSSGVGELSVFWRMENGLLLKIRPDWLGVYQDAPFMLDVKTLDDVNDFGRQAHEHGYHIQAAYYGFVLEHVFGMVINGLFCTIGKRTECGRYPVELGPMDNGDSEEGLLQVHDAITVLNGPDDDIASCFTVFSRPSWAKQADRKRREAQEVMA
ncbi:gp20 [Sodalis phage phiSG1]|nr:gp20 [Sodalis phage phiSG1]